MRIMKRISKWIIAFICVLILAYLANVIATFGFEFDIREWDRDKLVPAALISIIIAAFYWGFISPIFE